MPYILLTVTTFVLWYAITAAFTWYRLREFPAPSWLANISYLWLGKTTYSGKQYWVHRDLHTKYGPLVRIGPNELVTDDPEIIRKMSAARSPYARGDWYVTGRFNPYHDNSFTSLDPVAHGKDKARVAGIYNGREIGAALEPAIDDQVRQLVDLLRRKYAVPGEHQPLLDLGKTSEFFTMDVITRLTFGQEFGYLKDEKDHYNFLGGVHSLWPQMSTSADVPWIRNILFSKTFLKLFGPKTTDKNGFGALMGVAERHVGKRFGEEEADKKEDWLGSYIRRGMAREECEAEGLLLVISGTESTASAIRSVLVHTITSPLVYNRLKVEISDAVARNAVSSIITVDEAKRLPYLQAVIYEGIRMRPPLLGLFPKVVPEGGDNFHGKFIPGGTSLCMNTSSLLRSPAIFGTDSEVFRPERFVELDEERRIEMQRNVELAFGYGQNQCAGKQVVFTEINKALFELLRNFDLQLISPVKPCDVMSYGIFVESNMLIKVTEGALAHSKPHMAETAEV